MSSQYQLMPPCIMLEAGAIGGGVEAGPPCWCTNTETWDLSSWVDPRSWVLEFWFNAESCDRDLTLLVVLFVLVFVVLTSTGISTSTLLRPIRLPLCFVLVGGMVDVFSGVGVLEGRGMTLVRIVQSRPEERDGVLVVAGVLGVDDVVLCEGEVVAVVDEVGFVVGEVFLLLGFFVVVEVFLLLGLFDDFDACGLDLIEVIFGGPNFMLSTGKVTGESL